MSASLALAAAAVSSKATAGSEDVIRAHMIILFLSIWRKRSEKEQSYTNTLTDMQTNGPIHVRTYTDR